MAADGVIPVKAKTSMLQKLDSWGNNSLPPVLMATLVTALHYRPWQPLPLFIFTPPLLFSSYLNLSGYPTGSAGLTAAWSGLYALLALRGPAKKGGIILPRRPGLTNPAQAEAAKGLRGVIGKAAKSGVRGAVRAGAVGLGVVNCAAGAYVYARGDWEEDREERVRRNRWSGE